MLAHPRAGPADPAVAIREVSSASAARLPKSPGPGALSSSLPGQGPPCHRRATAIPLCVFLNPQTKCSCLQGTGSRGPGTALALWDLITSQGGRGDAVMRTHGRPAQSPARGRARSLLVTLLARGRSGGKGHRAFDTPIWTLTVERCPGDPRPQAPRYLGTQGQINKGTNTWGRADSVRRNIYFQGNEALPRQWGGPAPSFAGGVCLQMPACHVEFFDSSVPRAGLVLFLDYVISSHFVLSRRRGCQCHEVFRVPTPTVRPAPQHAPGLSLSLPFSKLGVTINLTS